MGQKGGGEIGRTLLSRLAGDACVSLFVFEIRKHTRAIYFLFWSLIRLGFIFAVRHKCTDAGISATAGGGGYLLIDVLKSVLPCLFFATCQRKTETCQHYRADKYNFIPWVSHSR